MSRKRAEPQGTFLVSSNSQVQSDVAFTEAEDDMAFVCHTQGVRRLQRRPLPARHWARDHSRLHRINVPNRRVGVKFDQEERNNVMIFPSNV